MAGTRIPMGLRGLRILVIEDAQDIREVFTLLLRAEGANVDSAANGREATELVAQQSFDVVLSDLGLPDIPGDVLIRELRARRAYHSRDGCDRLWRAVPDARAAGGRRRRIYKTRRVVADPRIHRAFRPRRVGLTHARGTGKPPGTMCHNPAMRLDLSTLVLAGLAAVFAVIAYVKDPSLPLIGARNGLSMLGFVLRG